jgi:hypothetical protein
MTQLVLPVNKQAVEKADNEFYRRHPEKIDKPLSENPKDAKYRIEWLQLYKQFGGRIREPVRSTKNKTSRQAVCVDKGDDKHLKVYVYLYQTRGDGHGHVGMVIEQKSGEFIRYSQAAENPNLQGWEIRKYLINCIKVKVRTKTFSKHTNPSGFAKGAKIIRIPTKYPEKIQKAVNEYIAEKGCYNLVTNNCADFVNDTINAADDVSVWDKTIPNSYYQQLEVKYPNCAIN